MSNLQYHLIIEVVLDSLSKPSEDVVIKSSSLTAIRAGIFGCRILERKHPNSDVFDTILRLFLPNGDEVEADRIREFILDMEIVVQGEEEVEGYFYGTISPSWQPDEKIKLKWTRQGDDEICSRIESSLRLIEACVEAGLEEDEE